jgi:hypothetical protein
MVIYREGPVQPISDSADLNPYALLPSALQPPVSSATNIVHGIAVINVRPKQTSVRQDQGSATRRP